ncbi:hypothetical protein NQ317_013589 [Molorchus minor]|uniref:Uncharacterized protein n=1 Tax=Molorchus minor TaxID=1323400 RepID=A0ABQ9IWD9_9CUCU|nr:hypothetical protein NQ317_013589 [Molorchus minor]
MWSFDPVSRSWFSEPGLLEPRKNFGLVACNNCLYAIGGQGKHYDALNSVERYNIEERRWEEIAPMKYSRTGAACAKYRSHIWVAGGLSGKSKKRILVDSIESCNYKTDQ